jgi:hypothetical protein
MNNLNFKINKGSHYSSFWPTPLKKEHFARYIVTIKFKKIEPKQEFYSKLIGFGALNPRWRSERIGWRFFEDDTIELCNYSETKYKFHFIDPIQLPIFYDAHQEMFFVQFRLFFRTYLFELKHFSGERSWYIPPNATDPKFLFLNKPYHGGDPEASQDFIVNFEKQPNE